MFTLEAHGPNDVYDKLVSRVLSHGTEVTQRGLTTRELHPVVIEFDQPLRRLVTSYGRPINVAFALAEVLWILAGREDVDMLAAYNSRISDYSDNGVTFNAAYGFRMREQHGYDQLVDAERILRADKGSRQAIIGIWHPNDRGFDDDFDPDDPEHFFESRRERKDRACNVLAHPMIRNNKLDWMQIVRSNDLIWGTPYNWMQWTHLQEYLAGRLGVPVGKYIHVADSLHIYDHHYKDAGQVLSFDLYHYLSWKHRPLGHMDREDIDNLIEVESLARTGALIPLLGNQLIYWQSVMDIFQAHHFYKQKTKAGDYRAYDRLIETYDRVYALTQLKFYLSMRWSNNGHIRRLIDRDFDGRIHHWLTWKPEKEKPVG